MDIVPVLIYKSDDSTDFSVSCILGMSVLSFILLLYSYVPMGIGAQMGQLPAREQCQVINDVNFYHWKVQTLTSVLSFSKGESGAIYDGIPCYF